MNFFKCQSSEGGRVRSSFSRSSNSKFMTQSRISWWCCKALSGPDAVNPILSVGLVALGYSLPLRHVLAFSSPTYVCRNFNSQYQRPEIRAMREKEFGGKVRCCQAQILHLVV